MIPEDILEINVDEKFAVASEVVNKVVEEMQTELNFTISSVSINFLDENYILELNREHLNHDYNTDIITFNYSGENDKNTPVRYHNIFCVFLQQVKHAAE